MCKKLLHKKLQKQRKNADQPLATASAPPGNSPQSPQISRGRCSPPGERHHRCRSVPSGDREGAHCRESAVVLCGFPEGELAAGERITASPRVSRRDHAAHGKELKRRNGGERKLKRKMGINDGLLVQADDKVEAWGPPCACGQVSTAASVDTC
jgi:hypothetical protein